MSGGSDNPPLIGTEWAVMELNGTPAGVGNGDKPATLVFAPDEHHASGFAGCNSAGGSFTHSGDELRFGPIMMTRMACQRGMELEQRYSAALSATRRYRIADGELQLLSDDSVVARLVARHTEP